ncbi:hypothetical protein [Cellulomonas humilata]|uniref:RNA polymerase sigma-70 region 4 domain-containing protein n=1 Tax=Cellulomonas humilata TaxID=144055 RepID=A0ABU0EMF9_9CELL|nr:hypothetical protein [Cellulomonas humilata]MDQ0375997.1 hypothetical protein [Cellulomonas humilata]
MIDTVRLSLRLGNDARGHGRFGPFTVEPDAEILIGRAARRGLRLVDEWVPRDLVRLRPAGEQWLLVNGPSAAVHVQNKWVTTRLEERWVGKGEARRRSEVQVGVEFKKGAVIALPPGRTIARWTIFDDDIWMSVNIGGSQHDAAGLPLPALRAESSSVDPRSMTFTHIGGRSVRLAPDQRRAMAVLFRHQLDDRPRPRNLEAGAAKELGITEDALKKRIRRARAAVNKHRDAEAQLDDLDEFGAYLIETSRIVTADDLALD